MKVKKILCVILALVSLLSLCSFSSFAAESAVQNLDTYDGYSYVTISLDGVPPLDLGDALVKSSKKVSFMSGTVTALQLDNECYETFDTYDLRFTVWKNFTVRPEHEYNIKFSYGYDIDINTTLKVVLSIYDSNHGLVSTKELYNGVGRQKNLEHFVDFNFILDKSELPNGYLLDLELRVNQKTSDKYISAPNGGGVYFSQYVTLTDNDDNSGWFQKIINAIKDIPASLGSFFSQLGDRISGFFTDLGNKITTGFTNLTNNIKSFFTELGTKITNGFNDLKNNIQQFFTDLGEDIKGFFEMLKNYLLYFQHPVTVNSDGVLIGKDGKPVYTNPFDSPIETVEETVNGWIDKLNVFIDSMEESRVTVSTYLEQGSSLVTKVFSAVPLLSVVVIFAAGFLVIRKVVGR